MGPDNRSRGYGTVLLATSEDAGRAIDMLNGYEWQTRVLEVRVDRVGGVGIASGSVGLPTTGGYDVAPSMAYPAGAYSSSAPISNQQYGPAYPIGIPQQHQQRSYRTQGSDPVAQQQQQILQPIPIHQQQLRYPAITNIQHHSQGQGPSTSAGGSGMNAPGRTLFVGNVRFSLRRKTS